MTQPEETISNDFQEFGLQPEILASIKELGFRKPTPIQQHAIPQLLSGVDVIGRARTGSGKTAAFGLPILHQLQAGSKKPQALILAPTRELAIQVSEAMESYAKHLRVKITTIYGGSPYPPQLSALKSGVAVVVGTPGRVLDHIKRGSLQLDEVNHVVLDEADEMLKMGFIEDVESILEATSKGRQMALFSATMPKAIRRIGTEFMTAPVEIQVESKGLTTEHIEQQWMASRDSRKTTALSRILEAWVDGSALIFTRTRLRCAEVADFLTKRGIMADALHGDMSQPARERVLDRFRSKTIRLLVATDVAARGIDVDHITHVINYDLPSNPETYVHRIGRTGRAGRSGVAISLVAPPDRRKISLFQKSLKVSIKEMQPPSLRQISQKRLEQVKRQLSERMEGTVEERMHKWLVELKEERDASFEEIACALMAELSEIKGIKYRHEADPLAAKSKTWTSETEKEQAYAEINAVEVILNIGKRDGVGPSDIVWAVSSGFDIPGSRLGRMKILGRKTLLGLPTDLAEIVLAKNITMEIRGKTVRVFPSTLENQQTVASEKRPRKKNRGFSDNSPGRVRKVRKHRGKQLKERSFAGRPKKRRKR